jgi:hypothetical protein
MSYANLYSGSKFLSTIILPICSHMFYSCYHLNLYRLLVIFLAEYVLLVHNCSVKNYDFGEIGTYILQLVGYIAIFHI